MIELLKNLYASAFRRSTRVTPPIFFDGIPDISYGTTYPSLQRIFGRANRLWLTIPMSPSSLPSSSTQFGSTHRYNHVQKMANFNSAGGQVRILRCSSFTYQ
jgi:hypothetical protein